MGGLPSLMNTYGVWYNADAFTAAGLPLPKAGWTWDDMYTAAAKLANKNGAKYGLVADQLTGRGRAVHDEHVLRVGRWRAVHRQREPPDEGRGRRQVQAKASRS